MPFIFRGCQGWFQHLKERRIKNICISLYFSLARSLALPPALLGALLLSPSLGPAAEPGLCVGEGVPERVFRALRAPVGWDPNGRRRSRTDSGGEGLCVVEGEGGEPGLAGAAALGVLPSAGISSVTPQKSSGPQICPSPGRPRQPLLASEVEI